MTEGNSSKKLMAFALPVLAGAAFSQLAGLVESLLISRFAGVGAFSAMASAVPAMLLMTGFLFGMCSGFMIPAVQLAGAGDETRFCALTTGATTLCATLCMLFSCAGFVLAPALLTLCRTPSDTFVPALRYMRVNLVAGMPAAMAFMLPCALMRAKGFSAMALRFQALSFSLEILLTRILVAPMGLPGAALASALASLSSAIPAWIALLRSMQERRARFAPPGRALLLRLVGCGLPVGLQSIVAALGAMAFQSAVNALGSADVAGISAAERALCFASVPTSALGAAIEVYAGQNLGAGRYDRIHMGMRNAGNMLFVWYGISLVFLMLLGRRFAGLFLGGQSSPLLTRYLFINAAFIPLFMGSSMLRNALQGLGKPGLSAACIALESLVRLTMVSVPLWQPSTGICFASPAAWLSSFIVAGILYRRQMRFLKRRVPKSSAFRRILPARSSFRFQKSQPPVEREV